MGKWDSYRKRKTDLCMYEWMNGGEKHNLVHHMIESSRFSVREAFAVMIGFGRSEFLQRTCVDFC